MKFSKERQLGKKVPESLIQRHTDDRLTENLIENLRVDEEFWVWARHQAPRWRKKLASMFKSLPDNTCWIPVSDKYSLCLHLELKTKTGKLSQGQRKKDRVLPWQIARSFSEVDRAIGDFVLAAERVRKALEDD